MSLINDALKKAKQAQAAAPARQSAPQLRSPETDHPVRSGSALMLPAIIVAVGLVGAALVWVAVSGRKPGAPKEEAVVAANPPPAPKTELAVAPATREVVSTSPAPVSVSTAVVEPKPTVAPSSPPVVAPAVTTPLAPVLPKLNGIFFNPTRPTAIVNNKLVSIGSRSGEFTVVAITQTSVFLVSGSQTNVLSLSE